MSQRKCRCGEWITNPVRTWCSDDCKLKHRGLVLKHRPIVTPAEPPAVEIPENDPTRIPEPLLREPIGTDTLELGAEAAKPPRRLIPGRFRFPKSGSSTKPELAAKSHSRPKETESRSAGGPRTIAVIGPKTQQAVHDGLLEVDFPDCVTIAPKSKRARVIEWAQIRAMEPGVTNIEIARRMGISPITLNGAITQGRREGWLKFEDPLSRMEFEIIPKTVDNLSALLDAKDKTATIETAKGTLFKSYLSNQGVSEQPQTVLALRIDRADGDNLKIVTGRIVGKSKYTHEQEAE